MAHFIKKLHVWWLHVQMRSCVSKMDSLWRAGDRDACCIENKRLYALKRKQLSLVGGGR